MTFSTDSLGSSQATQRLASVKDITLDWEADGCRNRPFDGPDVIASIYSMNFDIMPELHWCYGYAFQLAVIAVACGWLWPAP
jgi:hypothetical protein